MVSTVSGLDSLVRQQRDAMPRFPAEFAVADELRRLRVKRNLLVRELAQRAGLNARTLRKIEAGETSPSVSTLQQLLAALGVSFKEFLALAEPGPGDRRGLSSRGDGRQIRSPGGLHRLLSGELLGKKMLPMVSTLGELDAAAQGSWELHAGEAFVLVLSGQVMLLTEHYAPALLAPGDSVYFDCTMRYRIGAQTGTTAEVLWLTSLA